MKEKIIIILQATMKRSLQNKPNLTWEYIQETIAIGEGYEFSGIKVTENLFSFGEDKDVPSLNNYIPMPLPSRRGKWCNVLFTQIPYAANDTALRVVEVSWGHEKERFVSVDVEADLTGQLEPINSAEELLGLLANAAEKSPFMQKAYNAVLQEKTCTINRARRGEKPLVVTQ